MAEQQRKESDAKELKQDSLVEKSVPNPTQVPNVRVLRGFLGQASRLGYWRLYLTPQLNEYVELSENDIVNIQPVGGEKSAFGGTVLSVKQDAKLRWTRAESRQSQAEFVRCDIATVFLHQAGTQGPTGGRALALGEWSWCWGCWPTSDPSWLTGTSEWWWCASWWFPCWWTWIPRQYR